LTLVTTFDVRFNFCVYTRLIIEWDYLIFRFVLACMASHFFSISFQNNFRLHFLDMLLLFCVCPASLFFFTKFYSL
jgi:hypothetical protein